MKYYIGIDGGGSKTELLISDINGNIIKHTKGDSSNPASIGGDRSVQNVLNLIEKSIYSFDIRDIAYMSVNIPGIRHYSERIKVLADFIACGKADVAGDDESAFYGALAKESGIVILSGTGSFAMSINKRGQRLSVGGWGPLLGDEGSGYFMGIKAIRAAIAQYEYFGLSTVLTPMVLEHFSISDINMLKREVYKEGLNTKKIASLSKAVLKGATLGDTVSLGIIEESSHHLFKLVDVIIKKLDMSDGNYELCLTGGINNFGDYIMKPLKFMIYEKYHNISIIQPVFEPCVGSLIISLRKGGIEISDAVINNLKISLKGVGVSVI